MRKVAQKLVNKSAHLGLKLGVQKSPEEPTLEQRLAAQPQLRAQLEQLLDEVENRTGGLNLADDAEDVLVERMRTMTRQALADWAQVRQQGVQPRPATGAVRDVNGTPLADDPGLDRGGGAVLAPGRPPGAAVLSGRAGGSDA